VRRRRPIHSITVSKDATRAHVHTRVDEIYRRFLDEIETDCKSEQETFDAQIKVIIWGILYLEGLVNYKLYRYTERLFASQIGLLAEYWALTKQARLEDKLTLIFAADGVRRPWVKAALSKLGKVVELRNRLVHFKDAPTEFEFATLRSKLEINAPLAKWFEHVPDPRIVSELLSGSVEERKSFLQTIGDRLEDVQVA
jgi:hypothetical protein